MKQAMSILIVDDEETFREVLAKELRLSGYEAVAAPSGGEAEALLKERDFDLALVDIKMPDMDGLDLLGKIKRDFSFTEVIILTGHGTVERAIKAMKLGAYDFLMKPCRLDELEAVLQKAWERRSLAQQNSLLRTELARRGQAGDLVGRSQEFKGIVELINRVATTESPILIQGESGVGKELVAHAIHKNSPRKDNPFVIIDCASLQESLLESELFGHEKGAYTGAVGLKHGLFEVANTGTIFLDEIGELSASIQAKLLRVIETGSFRRLGGNRTLQVDVRIISASKRNLMQLVSEGQYREDLFYRLNVVTIFVPPLRDRREDIPVLADHFLEQAARGGARKRISREAMQILKQYAWPGNVRELQNVIERAIILSDGPGIDPKELPHNLLPAAGPSIKPEPGKVIPLRDVERDHIARVLKETKGHRSAAARILGISERSLYRKIKEFALD